MSPQPRITHRPDRSAITAVGQQYPAQDTPRDLILWQPPGGIKTDVPLGYLQPNESPNLNNFRIWNQSYRVRPTLAHLAAALADPVVTLVYTLDQDSNELIVAIGQSGIYRLVSGTFQAMTGPTLHADSFGRYSTSGWNKKMVYSNGYDPVGIADFDNNTYASLPGAPTGPFVTTFDGRILVANSNRITWCVKNNELNWTGFGSGYEDLLAAPGGVVDAVHGVFPQTDTYCMVVRNRSIWAMQLTGNFDAPFLFTRIWYNLESIAPWSLIQTPIGVIGLLADGVNVLTLNGAPQNIGLPVRDLMNQAAIRQAVATYDDYQAAYCLAIPADDGVATLVWRYYLREQRWTCDTYPFVIRHLTAAIYQGTTQIAELLGLVNALVGPIYLLGITDVKRGIIATSAIANEFTVREDNWNTGNTTDALPSNTTVAISATLDSDLLRAESLLNSADLVEVAIEYTATRIVPIVLQYSSNGGVSWNNLGTLNTVESALPQIMRFPCNLARQRVQIRLGGTDVGGFRLLASHPRFAQEGKLAP